MQFHRPACCLLMGILASATGMGCAAFNAVTHRPATINRPNSDRLTAIARVFENQGHLEKAQSMYRMAMRQDPGNEFAQERATYIASLQYDKSFGQFQADQAIAMADSIETRIADPQPVPPPTAPGMAEEAASRIASIAKTDTQAAVEESVAAAFTEAEEEASESIAEIDIAATGSVAQALAAFEEQADQFDEQTVSFEEEQIASFDSEPIDLVEEDVVAEELVEFPAVEIEVATESIAFTEPVEQPVIESTATGLEEVSAWMDAPSEHVTDLIRALHDGQDAGVKSLAAALLADCPADAVQIDQALESASTNADSLLMATIRDTQLRRGALNANGIEDLIGLLNDRSAEIRGQAAASLRYCVNTDDSNRCVNGLISLLEDGDAYVRGMAAATLGDFGSDAANAEQALREALASETNDSNVRAIENTLIRIGAGQTVVREQAVQLLPFVE